MTPFTVSQLKEVKEGFHLPRSKRADLSHVEVTPCEKGKAGVLLCSNRSMTLFSILFMMFLFITVSISQYLSIEPHPSQQPGDDSQSYGIDKEELENSFLFFPPQILDKAPAGFSDNEFLKWKESLTNHKIVKVEKGCGRMMNRLLILDDGSKLCCRYRQNQDQIQGEVFSFYLSRALGINKVSPTKLSIFNSSDPFWTSVSSQLIESDWEQGKLVILTKFIDSLLPVNIPRYFQADQNSVLDWSAVSESTSDVENSTLAKEDEKVAELVQWSDMIVFDYLTANLDRVVNNLNNLRWNSRMLQYPIHNLQKRHSDHLYLLFDNESGLLHSYRILDKYSEFHDQLLNSLCIFSPRTVANIRSHQSRSSLWSSMYEDFKAQDSLYHKLPKMPSRFVAILHSRLNRTSDHFHECDK